MLRHDIDHRRATITIDDPERRNPLSGEVLSALADALVEADENDDVRVIVLTGAGEKAFSAGADLSGGFFDDPVGLHRTRGLISTVFKLMRTGGTPIIARVNGHALAGGFGLAAACDIVVAVESAKMGATEVRVGLWPMQISAVLQRWMPPRQALELFLTGRIFTADEGVELGVVNKTVATIKDLDIAVDELVDQLVELPAGALSFGRDAFYSTQGMSFDDAVTYLQTGLTALSMTDDAREGVTAFMEKRNPRFAR